VLHNLMMESSNSRYFWNFGKSLSF